MFEFVIWRCTHIQAFVLHSTMIGKWCLLQPNIPSFNVETRERTFTFKYLGVMYSFVYCSSNGIIAETILAKPHINGIIGRDIVFVTLPLAVFFSRIIFLWSCRNAPLKHRWNKSRQPLHSSLWQLLLLKIHICLRFPRVVLYKLSFHIFVLNFFLFAILCIGYKIRIHQTFNLF